MYVFGAGISIFRLGGKGKGMEGKNEKKRGLNWKIVGKSGVQKEYRILNKEYWMLKYGPPRWLFMRFSVFSLRKLCFLASLRLVIALTIGVISFCAFFQPQRRWDTWVFAEIFVYNWFSRTTMILNIEVGCCIISTFKILYSEFII